MPKDLAALPNVVIARITVRRYGSAKLDQTRRDHRQVTYPHRFTFY